MTYGGKWYFTSANAQGPLRCYGSKEQRTDLSLLHKYHQWVSAFCQHQESFTKALSSLMLQSDNLCWAYYQVDIENLAKHNTFEPKSPVCSPPLNAALSAFPVVCSCRPQAEEILPVLPCLHTNVVVSIISAHLLCKLSTIARFVYKTGLRITANTSYAS